MAVRARDVLGGLSLAAWLAMLAIAIFAWAAIPDWPLPHGSQGTALPLPPDGCRLQIDTSLSTRRYVCFGTPADRLIGGVLNCAVDWVVGILFLPLFVLTPAFWLSSFFLLTVLLPILSLGFAASFACQCLIGRRAARRTGNPEGNLR